MKTRGFEIVKEYLDKDIHIPERKTAHSAGYDGIKPTLIPTGLKAYCGEDECFLLLNRSSGPKKGFLMANSIGLIDSDYYNNEDNEGHFYFSYFNCSDHDIEVKKGDVVGQIVFIKYLTTDGDKATGKRKGGFGSTDKK